MSQRREYTVQQISDASAIIQRLERLDKILTRLETAPPNTNVYIDVKIGGAHTGRIGSDDELVDGRAVAFQVVTQARDACIACLAEMGIRVAA
jgi:hypothetical protein